jgi:hypothetical protein
MDPDPDPGGPKTYGSDGSVSATLPEWQRVFRVRLDSTSADIKGEYLCEMKTVCLV